MSNLLFKDSITVFHKSSSLSSSYSKRTVNAVFISQNFNFEGDNSSTIYIPLFCRRNLTYSSPSDFSALSNSSEYFTIDAGDKFVVGPCDLSYPPDNAYTVKSLSVFNFGSFRMRHLKINANVIINADDDA